ncbi:MAG: hypothetical protein ACRDZ8_03750 [Acidimicrobiales bacterium]
MSRVTSKAWFGPKKYLGWGWAPSGWEGWAATALFVVLAIGALSALRGAAKYIVFVAILAVFGVVLVLTGDPPGGPRS